MQYYIKHTLFEILNKSKAFKPLLIAVVTFKSFYTFSLGKSIRSPASLAQHFQYQNEKLGSSKILLGALTLDKFLLRKYMLSTNIESKCQGLNIRLKKQIVTFCNICEMTFVISKLAIVKMNGVGVRV